jgi:hypothetical protein
MLRMTLTVVLAVLAIGSAPATRPASRPASEPAKLTAADTPGDVVGMLLTGQKYDPKTGMLTVRVVFGNKTNKRIVRHQGELSFEGLHLAERGAHSFGYSSNNAIEPGDVVAADVRLVHLPSDTEAEIAESRKIAAGISRGYYGNVKVKYEIGR